MLFTSKQRNFAKDPAVIHFNNKYYMYYTILINPAPDRKIGIGIAVSTDMENWEEIGSLPMNYEYEIDKDGYISKVIEIAIQAGVELWSTEYTIEWE